MNKKIRILLSEVYEDTIKSVPFATKGSLPFRWKNSELFSATPKNSGKSCCSNTDTSYRKTTKSPKQTPSQKTVRKRKISKKRKMRGYLKSPIQKFLQRIPNPSYSAWINTRSILNRVIGCTACGTFAGIISISPSFTICGSPPIGISASPSRPITRASNGAECSESPSPASNANAVTVPAFLFTTIRETTEPS